ncbi:hypothetical protein, partial [Mesorhizobium sp. M7A.F.Ca.US.007.01.1.1]|uniref:hypothetical protein n=1 Tax=Mesorhizobium sp. M7A.F.Ca.US.007.01.1.1 TaxID=2496712 RepID=UPI0019D1C4CB
MDAITLAAAGVLALGVSGIAAVTGFAGTLGAGVALAVTVFAGALAPFAEAFIAGVALDGAGLAAFFAVDAFGATTGVVGTDDVTTDSSV